MEKLKQKNIQRDLNLGDQEFNIELFDSISSTNAVAKNNLNAQPNKLHLVATNHQTAGKGRRGKSFYSALDHGLYFTLAFQPNTKKIDNIPLYTILAAATLVEVLNQYLEESLAIKWVNDIFYKGRKVSGILSETTVYGGMEGVPGVVVGIGINLAGDLSQTEKEVQAVAGTLFGQNPPKTFNQNDFLNIFIQTFYTYHKTFEQKSFMPIYEKHLLGIGKKITYTHQNMKQEGIIQGIDAEGHLLVKKPDQSIETLYGQAVHFGSRQFTK